MEDKALLTVVAFFSPRELRLSLKERVEEISRIGEKPATRRPERPQRPAQVRGIHYDVEEIVGFGPDDEFPLYAHYIYSDSVQNQEAQACEYKQPGNDYTHPLEVPPSSVNSYISASDYQKMDGGPENSINTFDDQNNDQELYDNTGYSESIAYFESPNPYYESYSTFDTNQSTNQSNEDIPENAECTESPGYPENQDAIMDYDFFDEYFIGRTKSQSEMPLYQQASTTSSGPPSQERYQIQAQNWVSKRSTPTRPKIENPAVRAMSYKDEHISDSNPVIDTTLKREGSGPRSDSLAPRLPRFGAKGMTTIESTLPSRPQRPPERPNPLSPRGGAPNAQIVLLI